MNRRFVIEAVMIAIYGQLLHPKHPVEYRIPYSTVMELYEMRVSSEPIMPEANDDYYVKSMMGEMIQFFEDPFNKKKLERALIAPWRESPPMPINDHVTFVVVNTIENAQYGELLDPVETDVVLLSLRSQCPILTDQIDFQEKVIQNSVPVQLFDIEDFEFALEHKVTTPDGHSQ
ncbi:MAG: ADP-heptose synthase [Candidatus Cohnella colombiensis]|uniref:ADP-heptose synthase n=1 Tax=Candidatus Cohnella colombiensis TaxID=3121368 RepID=A0AA95JD28_9BACL|nr:MAG: ADP-heptose synthase [Cohnella sp.]